jgi:hypothetical protein
LQGDLKSIPTSNAIERARRIKTKTMPPSEFVEERGNSGYVVLGFAGFSLEQAAQNRCCEAATEGHPIRRLNSPHDRVSSSRRRSR